MIRRLNDAVMTFFLVAFLAIAGAAFHDVVFKGWRPGQAGCQCGECHCADPVPGPVDDDPDERVTGDSPAAGGILDPYIAALIVSAVVDDDWCAGDGKHPPRKAREPLRPTTLDGRGMN